MVVYGDYEGCEKFDYGEGLERLTFGVSVEKTLIALEGGRLEGGDAGTPILKRSSPTKRKLNMQLQNGIRYEGDCMEIIPTLQNEYYDMILTDPPYAMPVTYHPQTWTAPPQKRWSDTSIMQHFFRLFVEISKPKIKPIGTIAVFCNAVAAAAFVPGIYENYRHVRHIVWDKKSIGMGRPIRAQHELILVGTCEEAYVRDTYCSSVFSHQRVSSKKRRHPAEKPVDMLSEIIDQFCPPEGRVLDPFAGSGAVYEAAVKCGRYCDLIELDPKDSRMQLVEQTNLAL